MDTNTKTLEARQVNLSVEKWTAERELDLRFRNDPDLSAPLPFTVDEKALADAAGPYDVDVEPGQIRGLAKYATGDSLGLVLVIGPWMKDIWIVAPFSPYSYPATDGEMATGIDLLERKVVQCWNARTAHQAIIAQSRVVGTVDDGLVEDAKELFLSGFTGEPVPDGFSRVVGPPMYDDPDDPRAEYLAESRARWDALTRDAAELESKLAEEERRAMEEETAECADPPYDSHDSWGPMCSGCQWADQAHKPCAACKGP